MSNDPTLYSTPAALPTESVTIEMERLPDGREAFNVKASAIQHQGAIWERVIHIILGGLRASIAQTCQPQAAESRIVQPQGFMLPPASDRG